MFELYTYKKKYKELMRQTDTNMDELDGQLLNTFTFLSANVYNFLPLVPYKQHFPMFKRFRFQQWLNGLDALFFDGKYPLKVKGWTAYEQRIREVPGIICAYHFGAYQLINYLLIKAKIPYVLMVGEDVKERWEKLYPTLLAELQEAEQKGRFLLLSANNTMALRQIKELMKSGYHLLLYVDGLEGLDEQQIDNLERTAFLGQHIHVPRGAAHLSHWLQVPLYPFLTLRNAWTIELIQGDIMQAGPGVVKAEYTAAVINKLFSFLMPYVMHWPEQWTNWPQLHRLLPATAFIQGERWCCVETENLTDAAAYGVYKVENDCFLLRKKDCKSFRLTQSDFDKLYQMWHVEA